MTNIPCYRCGCVSDGWGSCLLHVARAVRLCADAKTHAHRYINANPSCRVLNDDDLLLAMRYAQLAATAARLAIEQGLLPGALAQARLLGEWATQDAAALAEHRVPAGDPDDKESALYLVRLRARMAVSALHFACARL